jgi:hypothetical protein
VTTLLVRPYPVASLADAGRALRAAIDGDVGPLHALYVAASDALEDLDPDEVREPVLAHVHAGHRDKAALQAALAEADAWESVVALGATFDAGPRFRAFAWACASVRYLDRQPDAAAFARYGGGAPLPGLSIDDTALYALLPALLGLGPEFPDELPAPCPAGGVPAWSLVGLPEDDWEGVDPLDGIALTPEACAAAAPAASEPWRALLRRGAASGGLLVRVAGDEV